MLDYVFAGSNGAEFTSEHVNTMCSLAYTMLEHFLIRCTSGEITLHEIKEVESTKNCNSLKKIIDVILLKPTTEEKDIFQFTHLIDCINMVNAFKTQKRLLTFFCDYLKGQNTVVQGKEYFGVNVF